MKIKKSGAVSFGPKRGLGQAKIHAQKAEESERVAVVMSGARAMPKPKRLDPDCMSDAELNEILMRNTPPAKGQTVRGFTVKTRRDTRYRA